MPPKPPLTHFLCLPLATPSSRPQLQASLQHFASEVTAPNSTAENQLPSKAIRPVSAIHLTIGVMSLQTPSRIEAACSFLHSLNIPQLLTDAANNTPPPFPPEHEPPPASEAPLEISLVGLSPLPTPTRASTLYAHPTPSHPLRPFALSLHKSFSTAGFLLPEPRPLLLHATIANTIYARQTKGGKRRWGRGSAKIDATALVERWGNTVWAEGVRLERVAVCEMGTKKVGKVGGAEGEEEEYVEVASVALT